MSLALLSLAALCWNAAYPEPTIQCGSENGPSPEWKVQHALTPGDLRDLRVEPVKITVEPQEYSLLMNISWILRADASIRLLKATKICVTSKSNFQSYSCVRCNYTEAFQHQTRPSGRRWKFFYIGFPVELSTVYFIGAYNIPTANMNEDGPSLSANFTSPGCLDHIMKYKKKCIEEGSLWDPNITACKKNEKTVEVNFTTSPLGDRYLALIQNKAVLGFSTVWENKLTRTSVVIPVTGESEGAVVQLAPYFRTCGHDCIRHKGTVVLCPKKRLQNSLDNNDRTVLGGWLPLLMALLVVTWVLVVGIYLLQRHEKIKTTSFPATTILPPIKVLVVYPSEICFQHTVCYFTEFLESHCRSEVILEKWQKKKIAEMGPVQWLTTQKKAADRIIFLLSNDVNTVCDATCGKNEGSASENSQDLFPLAFNIFCSDLTSQICLHKYIVVYFREADTEDYSALNVCPKYHLMKEATAFCKELLHIKQHVSAGKRSQACHNC
ncbi:interleukin-17 receptor B [Orycteropus afer afer]|uniref:Interleukin-17 receptor B n=1 Tax=Orycteropus afer afer TaxID=1230840 RepID=A0A8B6ZN58_ORYAF|nr:interleukin-17 receptor B [Orycteropus afer afer]